MAKWRKNVRFQGVILAAALSLTACGGAAQPPAETPPQTEQPAAAVPSPEAPEQETTELVYCPEGEEVRVSAVRYIGDGYTIAIPTEGWRHESDTEDGVAEQVWESTVNEDVELQILQLGSRDLQAARDWVRADKEDFQLLEDKRGGLGGTDPVDHEILEVRFFQGESGVYALMYQYPEEAAEGFGVLLGVMADSFTVTE